MIISNIWNEIKFSQIVRKDRASFSTHLTQAILEGQCLDAELLHPLELFLVKVFKLVHGQVAVPVQVHRAEPEMRRIHK